MYLQWFHHPSVCYFACYVFRSVAKVTWLSNHRTQTHTIHSHLGAISLKSPNDWNMHVSGLWEKSGVPGENPCAYMENMQTWLIKILTGDTQHSHSLLGAEKSLFSLNVQTRNKKAFGLTRSWTFLLRGDTTNRLTTVWLHQISEFLNQWYFDLILWPG